MRIVGLLVVATLAAFAMLVAGCGIGTKSEGQLGHASFAWEECFLGCSVADNPMAAGGAQAQINVSLANGFSFNQVRSSNPSVATAAIGGSNGLNLALTSASPGQTQVQLIDASGKLVDQVTVSVTQTAKLNVSTGWNGAAPIVVEGSTQSFHVTTVDANNHTLIGTGSVTFEIVDPLQHEDRLVFGDSVAFSGHAGAGTITARAPATSVVQAVTIVPLTALTSLSPTVKANTVDSTGTHGNVTVVANSAGGAVYGVHCTWSIADPSVMLESESTTSALDSAPLSTTRFLLTRPGTFEATCVSGAVSTTVTLQR
jgi:hypothetical protein